MLALPPEQPFVPRVGAEYYGAADVAARYCGVAPPYPPPRGAWMHGWTPKYMAQDEAILLEYIDLHGRQRGKEPMWGAHEDDVPFFRSRGWDTTAIGLPVVYLPETSIPRRPRSLLVMPAHSNAWEKRSWNCREYARAIASIGDRFAEVLVCISPYCVANGYWVSEFEDEGLAVVRGADSHDRNALLRMQTLLSSFEYVTTNGFGSHIAYGALFGAKVSLYGTFAEVRIEDIAGALAPPPGNRFYEMLVQGQSEPTLRARFPFLFCDPLDARENVAWARTEVGAHNRLPPEQLRELFGWRDADLRRWRLVGRPVAEIRRALGRAVPEPMKRWARARLAFLKA